MAKPKKQIVRQQVPARRVVLILLILAAAGLVVYIPALRGPLIWDDEHLILNNSYLRSWQNLPQIFSRDIAAGAGRSFNFWRPLQQFSYLVDYSFWQQSPFPYHLENVILHIFGAAALCGLLYLMFDDLMLAALAGLLFVVHPVHTEAVAYVSGRADSLAFLFLMLTFIFYIKDRGWMLACYVAALMSRESALILPVLIGVYHAASKKPLNRRGFYALCGAAAFYIILRLTLLRSIWPQEPLSKITFADRWPGAFVALFEYARLLLLPFNLHMEYANELFKPTDPRVLVGFLVLCSLLFVALRKNTGPRVRFSILWFIVALLPVLNIFMPLNAFMAEHWLYLPSVGFFILAAGGLLALIRRWPQAAAGMIVLLVGFYGSLTFYNSRFWADPVALFERIVKLAPASSRGMVSLGLAYEGAHRWEEARDLLVRALAQKPDDYQAYNILGSVYHGMGDMKRAEEAWSNGVTIEPRFAEFYNNLGIIAAERKDLDKAVELFHEAIRRNPVYADARKNLAIAYYNEGRYDEALESWDKARQLGMRGDPVAADAFEQLRHQLKG